VDPKVSNNGKDLISMRNQEWLHGTQDGMFTYWTFPPPTSRSKPELFVHSMSFLITDRLLATKTGPLSVGHEFSMMRPSWT